MFSLFLGQLQDLRLKMELVESCSWSEETAENLLGLVGSAIESADIEAVNKPAHIESLIESTLADVATSEQVGIIKKMVMSELERQSKELTAQFD